MQRLSAVANPLAGHLFIHGGRHLASGCDDAPREAVSIQRELDVCQKSIDVVKKQIREAVGLFIPSCIPEEEVTLAGL
jgi:hypothetical protein